MRIIQVLFLLVFAGCKTEFEDQFCVGDVGCTSGITYSTLYTDTFTRADENPLAAPWTTVLANGDLFELKSNEANPSEVGTATVVPSALYNTNITATNVRISTSVRIGAGGYDGEMMVYARSSSSSSVANTYFCGIDPTSSKATIGKTVGGTASPVAVSTGTMTYNNGDTYTLTFTLEGTSLTCALSGSDSVSVSGTDTAFSSGYAGLGGGDSGNNVLYFDNFKAETGQ